MRALIVLWAAVGVAACSLLPKGGGRDRTPARSTAPAGSASASTESFEDLDSADESVYEEQLDQQCETPAGSDDDEAMVPAEGHGARLDRDNGPAQEASSRDVDAIEVDTDDYVICVMREAPPERGDVVVLVQPGRGVQAGRGFRHALEHGALSAAGDSLIVSLASQSLTGKTCDTVVLCEGDVAAIRRHAKSICKDMSRTSVQLFSVPRSRAAATLFRILLAFAVLHPDVGYNQAMSTLAASLLVRDFARGDAHALQPAGPPPFREIAAYRRLAELLLVPRLAQMYDASLSGWHAMVEAVRGELRAIARRASDPTAAEALWTHVDDVVPMDLLLMDMLLTLFVRFDAADRLPATVHRRLLELRDVRVLARAAALVLWHHRHVILGVRGELAVRYVREIRTLHPAHGSDAPQSAVDDALDVQRSAVSAAVSEMYRTLARFFAS